MRQGWIVVRALLGGEFREAREKELLGVFSFPKIYSLLGRKSYVHTHLYVYIYIEFFSPRFSIAATSEIAILILHLSRNARRCSAYQYLPFSKEYMFHFRIVRLKPRTCFFFFFLNKI